MSQTETARESASESPVDALRRIASTLQKSAEWDEVFATVIRERVSAARSLAEISEEKNPREAIARRLAGKAFLLALILLVVQDVIDLATGDQPFDFRFWSFLGSTLVYLLIGGMSYLLVLVVAYWYFIWRSLGAPRWSTVVRSFLFDNSIGALRVPFLLFLLFLVLWVVAGFDVPLLVVALVALGVFAFLVGTEGRPIRVFLVGPITQSSLVLGFRLHTRFLPARAVSCLATGLEGKLGGIIIDGSYSKVAREKLHEKVMKAADLSATIVIDARHENTELLKLIDILQLSKLPARPYVLRREESESNRLGDQVHLKIDGLSVTEEQLLEALCLERPNRRDSSSTEPQ